jgi:thiol:disulfide interchange protein
MVYDKTNYYALKINLKLIFILFTLMIYFNSFIQSLDFPKNKNILDTPKSENSRIEEMTELEEVEKRIFEKKENTIIVFYADWCHHWYKININ